MTQDLLAGCAESQSNMMVAQDEDGSADGERRSHTVRADSQGRRIQSS